MRRRVQETERRPRLMLAFLLKVAGDPDALRRLVGDFHGGPQDGAGAKWPRLLLDDGEVVQLASGDKTMSSVDGVGSTRCCIT
ncbi:unnamed protein product [Triticum turgidum subsp. durum]|uniref:Uncharacterized protein n=1 Tax=Triticum turgidum subsp. durum TaxID=4567 RepID=A0A9R0SRB4_TRITD|nr:unnamed protein product [Triticum turgidum subsp. durum]